MTKLRDKILTVLFVAFIGGMLLCIIILPKEQISVNEKRTLASLPNLSLNSVLKGKFEKDTEKYLTDHFPWRNTFTGINAYTALYTGRNGLNGIYKGKDGYLLSLPVKADYEQLEANVKAMMDFTEKTQIPSTLMIVPSAGYIMSDKLPKNHMEYKDKEIIDKAHKMSEAVIGYTDIEKCFMKIKDECNLYYKTDHHWTSDGAYNAYVEYCKDIGFEPMWEFDVSTYDGFYGTAYSKSALWNEGADTLEIWNYPYSAEVRIEDEEYVSEQFFYLHHLENMDKYPVFLDGNHAIERIVNKGNPDGGKLLVIKDSFAHCFVPFLVNHYSEIDMVDLRYYLDPVSELTNEKKYDRILYLYGISSLTESNEITILQ